MEIGVDIVEINRIKKHVTENPLRTDLYIKELEGIRAKKLLYTLGGKVCCQSGGKSHRQVFEI